jgi:hypothetical protein
MQTLSMRYTQHKKMEVRKLLKSFPNELLFNILEMRFGNLLLGLGLFMSAILTEEIKGPSFQCFNTCSIL